MVLEGETPPEVHERALAFLEDVQGQLAATQHYGVLAFPRADGGPEHTRLDYVHEQCVRLHQLKHRVLGLGLGSNKNFPRGKKDGQDEWKSLQGFSGLDICQSWAVLLNAGHLFGTFSTERPLLFELDRSLTQRDEFVEALCRFDSGDGSALRPFVQATLDNARLHSFHYLLALWRLRAGGPSMLKKNDVNRARLLVKAFLMPPNDKVIALKSTFQRIRKLVYLHFHSYLSATRHLLTKVDEDDLGLLFPVDALPEADWLASARWDVLDAMERYDSEALFGNSEATARVLAHVGEFNEWWGVPARPFADRVDALFMRPADWPPERQKDLSHYIELRVPCLVNWLHEVRHWRRNDARRDPWDGTSFFITPDVREQALRVDLYAPPGGVSVGALEHIVNQLTRPFAGRASTKEQQALWMSTARLTAKAFGATLKPPYFLRLRPVAAPPGHAGYATAGSTYEFVRGQIKGFLSLCSNEQRSKELRQLLAIADEVVGWRSPAMAMLATTEVVGSGAAGNNVVTELDGLLGYFEGGRLHWLVIETKKLGGLDGEKQLRTKLIPSLQAVSASQIERRLIGSEEVWSLTVPSPGHLPS